MKPYYETELGKLYHGDCLEIMPMLEPVDLVLTDPPYGMKWRSGVSVGPKGHGKTGAKKQQTSPIMGDDKIFDPLPLLNFPKVIMFGCNHYFENLPKGTILVWIKRLDAAFGSFLSDAELAWMKGGHGTYCFRDLSMRADEKNRKHPMQKPIPLLMWCIEKAKPDGIILDPYIGSGSVAIACERLNRRWIGIEISEEYCEIAAKRIENERKQLKWC